MHSLREVTELYDECLKFQFSVLHLRVAYSELYIIWPPTILITNESVKSIISVAGVDVLERTR